jgi:hypothetical protein
MIGRSNIKTHEKEIRRGLELLRGEGLDLNDPSPQMIPRLKENFGKTRESDLAIVFTLGKLPDIAAVDALVDIGHNAQDKALTKEIRRALFKLRQKGLSVRSEEAVPAKPSPPILESPAAVEGYMSAVDGSGNRLIWIVKPQMGHGLQTLQAMVSDREGLLRFGGAQIRRKELRNMAREIKEKHGISMIPVPSEYADQIIYGAYEKSQNQGRSGFENFYQLRAAIISGRPKSQHHPIYRRLEVDAVGDGAWREQSRQLLDEPELRFWFLDEEWVRPYLLQIDEAKSSRLVLNRAQKEERLAAIVRDAVKAFSLGDIGSVLQRRMEDMALYFLETGRKRSAELSLAVAAHIAAGDPGPFDVAFLIGWVQKSFGFYLSQEKSKEAAEPSFIIKP